MSKSVSILAAGATASLQQFASTLISKTTGSAAVAAASADVANIAIGSDAPRGVHTSVVANPTDALYSKVNATLVRAVLPRGAEDSLQLRDAIDVLPGAGINADAEIESAKASFRKSAAIAVQFAKAQKAGKLVLAIKQQTKFSNSNALFQEAAKEVAEAAGLSVEVVSTAVATNTLVLFPETVQVVFTNDNATTDNLELAFAGVTGGSRTLYTEGGAKIAAAHGNKGVAVAVAETLKGLGLVNEAKKIESAVAKAKSSKDILAAL